MLALHGRDDGRDLRWLKGVDAVGQAVLVGDEAVRQDHDHVVL
jgi:hypothetical protein